MLKVKICVRITRKTKTTTKSAILGKSKMAAPLTGVQGSLWFLIER